MKKTITTDQDLERHSRLTSAYWDTIHDDNADQAAYDSREAKHWDFCTKGSSKNDGKHYFARSPYSSIECCGGGFILHNHVTGKRWPFATFDAAMACRGGTIARYSAIEHGR